MNKFARGGVAPGSGNRDTVPAMLTPGEGILTKKEMKNIGGPKGFAQLRKEIQYFKGGGVVGWVKDKLGSATRGAIYPGAKAVADKWIYPKINSMQSGNGFNGLMKAGSGKLVDKTLSWLKGDDSKFAKSLINFGMGKPGIGYKAMMATLHKQFPGLPLISGFRPGARTLSGNRSYHSVGRAVDLQPRRDVAEWIYNNFKSKTKELITPFQEFNLHNGRNHRYTGAIWNQHNFAGGNAHDHWAMDNGGVLPPKSTTMVTNATSQREFALTEDKLKDIAGNTYNITMQVRAEDIDSIQKVIEVFADLDKSVNTGFTGV
jgi:hypothetical protein